MPLAGDPRRPGRIDEAGSRAKTVPTAGADRGLFILNFLGRGKNTGLILCGAKTWDPKMDGRDASYGFNVTYPDDVIDVTYRWRVLGENYNPALGFVAGRGIRLQQLRTNLRPRPGF